MPGSSQRCRGRSVRNPLAAPLPEGVSLLDAHAFCTADAADSLPACWNATSDSVAARVAVVLGAAELVLLKSVAVPEPCDWVEAGRRGWVDPHFAAVLGRDVSRPTVRAVNLRTVRQVCKLPIRNGSLQTCRYKSISGRLGRMAVAGTLFGEVGEEGVFSLGSGAGIRHNEENVEFSTVLRLV